MKLRVVTNGTYFFPQYKKFFLFWSYFVYYDKDDIEFNYPRRELFGTLEDAKEWCKFKIKPDPKEEIKVVWNSKEDNL
jgi:hypothetical protein